MRKVLQPNSNEGDRRYPPPKPTYTFEHGVIKDPPASDIPDSALADAYNVFPFPTEIQSATGSLLYTLTELPPIRGRSGYSLSKTEQTVTATLSVFQEGDVGNYIVWPDGFHDEIIEYLSGTQVRVANSGTYTIQAGCYLRGKNNGFFFHEQLKRWVFQLGQEFYHAGIRLLGLSRALIVSRDIPYNTQSGYASFDDYSNVWFNSNGIFRVNMETEPALAYKLNTPVPNIAILPKPEQSNSNYSYRYRYSMVRIDGNQNIRTRLMEVKIECESGSNQESTVTNAAELDKVWTVNAISNTNNEIVGPVWIPSVVLPDETNYEWHWTHYVIWRTLDLEYAYARLGELDTSGDKSFNNPERFVWGYDLRTMGAFYATKGGGIITALVGEFEVADVGCTIEWDNGDRDEIVAYVNETTVRYRLAADQYYEEGYTRAACIGNGRVARATQSGDIVTRTHGTTFTAADVRKTIQWADGYRSYIVGYIDANRVRVHESFTREVQGLTLDPRYRYFNDTVTDSQLRARFTRLLLRKRFWRALPNCNGGVLPPGFMVTYQRNDNVVRYCQLPEDFEYWAGYHNPGIQLTRTIKDDIQFMMLFPDRIIAWSTGKTYYCPTNSPNEVVDEISGEVVSTLPGFEVLDGDKGLFDRGSIQPIGNGNIELLTSEQDRVALRWFNGKSYSDDKAFVASLGQGRLSKDLQELQRATASLYTPEGHYIWGRDPEASVDESPATRSSTPSDQELVYAGITLDVGPGGDYDNWTAAWASLAGTTLDNNYNFRQIGSVTEDNWPNWGAGVTEIDLNGYTLRFYCPPGNGHRGNPNQGYKTYLSGGLGRMDMTVTNVTNNPNSTLIVDGLNIEQLTNNNVLLLETSDRSGGGQLSNYYVRNLIIKGFSNAAASGWHAVTPLGNYYLSNIKCLDLDVGINGFFNSFNPLWSSNPHFVDNVSAHNCGTAGFQHNPTAANQAHNWTVRNMVVVNSGAFETGGAGLDIYLFNCADDDNSIVGGTTIQSNCIASITPLNEFRSVTYADDEFLDLILGTFTYASMTEGVATGGAPNLGLNGIETDSETDIMGEDKPGLDGFYSIGAVEQRYTVTNEVFENNLDIQAVPYRGLTPLGVQFSNIAVDTSPEVT